MASPSSFSPNQTSSSYIHKVVDSTVLNNRISPTWSKVSTTCYAAHTKKVQGYGRLVRNITVSHDCPQEFYRTDHLPRPKDFIPAPKEFASRKAGVEAAYVLPGGSSFRDQPIRGRQYEKIKIDKQYIIEPKVTSRNGGGSRIDLSWDSGRRSARALPGPPSSSTKTSTTTSSQLTLSPVKIKKNIPITGGIRPGTGGQLNSGRNILSNKSDAHCPRVRTASSSSRGLGGLGQCTGFSDAAPKSFSNKKSWWIHED